MASAIQPREVAVPQDQTPHPVPVPIPKRKRRLRTQRGSIVRRKSSWIAMYRDRAGKQHGVTFRTKTEASAHLTEVLALIRQDKYVVARPELFSDYVEQWLKRRALTLKPGTLGTYRTIAKKWLAPTFGEYEMREIDREQVRAFAFRLLETKLKGKSVRLILTVLHELFEHAIDDRVAQANPAHRLKVDLPKDSVERRVPERTDVTATFHELDAHPQVQVFLALTAMTGLRRGEALALWWSDLDFQRGLIRVERSLTHANKDDAIPYRNIEWHFSTTLAVVPPKSKTSRRTVAMPLALGAMLQRLRAGCRNASPFVFQDEAGAPLDPQPIYKVLHAAQDRAGVKRFNPHGLRHRFISELQGAGASPAHARDRAGHASIQVTDRYSHDLADAHVYADAVARAFPFDAEPRVNLKLSEGASAQPSR